MRRSLSGVIVLMVLSFTPQALEAQDCIDYADYMRWVVSVELPGSAQGVAIDGGHAYVADGGDFHIIDISNSALPRIEGSVQTLGDAEDVAVSENLACVADNNMGL